MVQTRRAARQIHYDLADEKIRLCVRSMEAIMGDSDDPAMALESVLGSVMS